MDKLIKPYDKEYMRLAMLKHDEIFKQQVYELHRLYRIQKMLMANIVSTGSNNQNQEKWNSTNIWTFSNQTNHVHNIQQDSRIKLDLEQPAKDHIAQLKGNQEMDIIDESEIELTLGPTNYSSKRKAGTSPNSDSGLSFASSSTGSSQINRTTLGTHQRTYKTREVLSGCQLGHVQVPETISGFQKESKNSANEEQLRRDNIENHLWLIQPLGLNMT